MAIITKAGTPEKGAATVFTLDKAELALHAAVSGDAYFSNQAVWDKVKVYFNSTVGGQIEILTFDATLSSPTADFSVFANARNIFQVSYLEIIDFQGGKLNVPRVDLAEVDFDVDVTGVTAPTNLVYNPDTAYTEAPNPVNSSTPTIDDGGEAVVYSLEIGGGGADMGIGFGVTINSSTGVISWNSPDAGSFSTIVRATNSQDSTTAIAYCEVSMPMEMP